MQNQGFRAKNDKGFTLVELLVVIAIVAMLASLGYPMYQNHVLRGQRSAATATLLKVASRMETFRLDNKTYNTTAMTSLGFAADPLYINAEGFEVPAASATYSIDIQAASAVTYTLVAIPQNNQVRDKACAQITLTNTGIKAALNDQGGASKECWR